MTQKQTAERVIPRYDPRDDLAERFPDWTVRVVQLRQSDEVIIEDERLILLDVGAVAEDADWAWAHVLAHLVLHAGRLRGGPMSHEMEDEASALAWMWLDRHDRP